ncbi:hypothetical protein [Caballeronia sp. LZ016]|uniref:hypothetical protein n=1 Tax=Caballeronia sp. LZ016 TaxID=3038554 RepID=UPI00285B1C5A|nr:hypothetical protein [Caballeronia sp. LZ016]MDR5738879.1 hypothetical protein [Caballeronia sp. LZ016]
MKVLNALANREFLVLVAIVVSALTLHVREQVVDRPAVAHANYTLMCEPSAPPTKKAKLQSAECDVPAGAHPPGAERPWV